MKLFVYLILISTLNLFSQNWQRIPEISTGTYVHSIFYPKSSPNNVIVIADSIPIDKDLKNMFPPYFAQLSGYGYFVSNDGGSSFPTQKIEGTKIFLALGESPKEPNTWICSAIDKNISKFGISTDKGTTWDFEKSQCNTNAKIINLINISDNIYGAGVSTGFGLINGGSDFMNCQVNDTLNASVRDIQMLNNKLFIASDDNAKPGVFYSTDLGITWNKDQSGLSGVRVNTVCPSPAYEIHKVVVCGGDKYLVDQYVGAGIFYSSDNGANWKLQGAANAKVYDIKYHPKDPLLMVAACGKDGLYVSQNGGINWEQFNNGLPDLADIRRVSFPDKAKGSNGYEMYIGIYGEGLWKTSNLNVTLTSVENNDNNYNNDNNLKVAPNPISDKIDLYFNSNISESVSVEIINLQGENIYNMTKVVSAGENYINISNLNINTGVYFLKITSNSGISTAKIIKN